MKKAQRIQRKQAHVEAYYQGWNECEEFYAGVLAKLLPEEILNDLQRYVPKVVSHLSKPG